MKRKVSHALNSHGTRHIKKGEKTVTSVTATGAHTQAFRRVPVTGTKFIR